MRKLIQPFLLFFLAFIVFHSWFLPGLLSTYDFPYFSPLMMRDAGITPYAWGWHVGLDGFARFISPYAWVLPFIYAPQVILGKLGMDWLFIERVMYLYPFLILLIVSPILLIRYIFPKNRFYLLSVLIFSFNTYALILAGGEIFVALAYALAPIILVLFMHILRVKNLKTRTKYIFPIITGLILAVQIMTDPRITYVTMFMVIIYLLCYYTFQLEELRRYSLRDYIHTVVFVLLIPGAIAVLLHAFWIIPSVLHGGNPVEALGSSHSTVEAIKYFSFARFENTISLLQPNWPENVFGKVGFMKPEFLLLPILAFGSLLFINKLKNKQEKLYVVFFAFLGLLGAFLSKGSNEPFGGIYLWMFRYVPGFILFRDPTKWYLLIAISYSVLIPFTVWKTCDYLGLKFNGQNSKGQFKIQKFLPNLFLILIILYLLMLIRPAILGQLGGMFKATNVPKDYVKLEKFLANQPDYFRTLWVPSKQRFGYYSNNHPEMSAQVLFNVTDNEGLSKKLTEQKTEKLLQDASVKYVVVPYDSEKEIFLADRKYSEKLYVQTINSVDSIKWLKKVEGFGKIAVFEVPNPKDHLWTNDSNMIVNYKYINPTKYLVEVKKAKTGDLLVFSESFDKGWEAQGFKSKIKSVKFDNRFNSFKLPKNGDYALTIYFTPQDRTNIGMYISIATFFAVILVLVGLKPRK